ncbi:four helix bundle protein [Hymenobacter glaciei]|uniref:Four helix bundle protein n=1 Tax=Hymenobacter glaciei TaxID=877209 RepID=A0ABP7TY63_9BACT
MHNFKELHVWKKAMDTAQAVHAICQQLPDAERYGLISQMRRAAISVPSNIAEGSGRGSNADFRRFLSIAGGSAYELETQLLLTGRFNYCSQEQLASLLMQISELQKMLYGLRNSLRDN